MQEQRGIGRNRLERGRGGTNRGFLVRVHRDASRRIDILVPEGDDPVRAEKNFLRKGGDAFRNNALGGVD
jgi:hypothetical protein